MSRWALLTTRREASRVSTELFILALTAAYARRSHRSDPCASFTTSTVTFAQRLHVFRTGVSRFHPRARASRNGARETTTRLITNDTNDALTVAKLRAVRRTWTMYDVRAHLVDAWTSNGSTDWARRRASRTTRASTGTAPTGTKIIALGTRTSHI